MKKPRDTYRFVIQVGPAVVHGGITEDLARSKAEGRLRWPDGRFHQVGDITTVDEAQEWAKKNRFVVESDVLKDVLNKEVLNIDAAEGSVEVIGRIDRSFEETS